MVRELNRIQLIKPTKNAAYHLRLQIKVERLLAKQKAGRYLDRRERRVLALEIKSDCCERSLIKNPVVLRLPGPFCQSC